MIGLALGVVLFVFIAMAVYYAIMLLIGGVVTVVDSTKGMRLSTGDKITYTMLGISAVIFLNAHLHLGLW
jgi:hypothetical protein